MFVSMLSDEALEKSVTQRRAQCTCKDNSHEVTQKVPSANDCEFIIGDH